MSDLLIPFSELKKSLQKGLESVGFSESKASQCAELFATTDLDGVRSHGIERFDRLLQYIRAGVVLPDKSPVLLSKAGFFERWDGQLGPGNLNAQQSMNRAMELASENGIGCVALANTNHWMRGGSYGWQAVEQGKIGICFTNTMPNMPAWDAKEPRLGNNPLVIGIPREGGHLVLDMAMSQFAYGKLSRLAEAGEQAAFPAGLDEKGNLTHDPKIVMQKQSALPVGLWKGAGLSLMIDLLAALLSGGNSTKDIGKASLETGLSQVFIALDPKVLGLEAWFEEKAEAIVEDYLGAEAFAGKSVFYPGQQTMKTRQRNLEHGIPVAKKTWEKLLNELK
ncbi:3-dehydro-L-gulonate 2-dehydrogenase [Algoriphagus jejuensis]|uniref:3-dehydro-L-gulonate 2-dehydrogenase n=1 Tax=Algoriphagus jejuensis TaxID=419934 RepID=A0ABN1N079_9BACT